MSAVPQFTPIPAWRLLATLGLTALISGVLVVGAYEMVLPRIKENRRVTLENALRQVLPGAARYQVYALRAEGPVPVAEAADEPAVYAGYDTSGTLTGLAIEGAARGYQDTIRLLYAYTPACECITGIHVLRNVDTPGIGDKVSKDAGFLVNFKALEARLNPDRSALAHAIVTVKHGKKTEAWQIDAISGATVSSRAVGRAINDSAQTVLPQVVTRLERIRHAPEPTP